MGMVVGALLAGCPGELDRPERFDCTDVEAKIFKPKCGTVGCHGNPGAANNLDLVAPGVKGRLNSQISTCQSKPMKSFMLEKLKGTPGCGTLMPLGGDPLTADEYKCVEDYLSGLDGG